MTHTPNADTADTVELLPCPFCGGTDVSSGEVLACRDEGKYFKQTACNTCGACGPEAHMTKAVASGPAGDAAADAMWNDRSVPSGAAEALPARKTGKELAPFRSGSHLAHAYADGWNACLDAINATPPAAGVSHGEAVEGKVDDASGKA